MHRPGRGATSTRWGLGWWWWERASCPQELLDHVAREAVQEKGQHEQPQQRQHDLDDEPLVPCADEVLDGLEGVEEPDEGGVRTAGGGEGTVRQRASPRAHQALSLLRLQRSLAQPLSPKQGVLGPGFQPFLSTRFAACIPGALCRTLWLPHKARRPFWESGSHPASTWTIAALAAHHLKRQPQSCRWFWLLGTSPV